MTPTQVSPLTSTPPHDRERSAPTDLAPRIEDRTATVAVVGLGCVGVPLLAAAGAEAFRLVGVDVDPAEAGITRALRAESFIRR